MIFKKLPNLKSRRSSALSEDLAGLLAVVSLLFSCSSSELLEMLCSTGTSTGIKHYFLLALDTCSLFPFSSETLE